MNQILKYTFLLFLLSCKQENTPKSLIRNTKTEHSSEINKIPEKNKLVICTVKEFGPKISPTYEKAVCTEMVIQILEKIQPLNTVDKQRIRIITDENIQQLLKDNSDIPKGVYFALIKKGVGIPIDNINEVCEGDFVQFWTETWGHCGIIKSIDIKNNEMELYSSFPSTQGYGIQKFSISHYVYFVRLK